MLDEVLTDLRAECADLDALVADLPDGPTDGAATWRSATPAPGWTVAHQIAHLAWTDEIAALAATDPAAFLAAVQALLASGEAPEHVVDREAETGAAASGGALLTRWRSARAALDAALRAVPDGTKLPWFGPPMAATSMATARLMETWAHGQDVADALGVTRVPTARLRHVARLAVRTTGFSFAVHGRPPPADEIRVELTAPDGGTWVFGPPDAAQHVTGPALDLCLLAARRRHRADTALVATGPDADAWLDVAQAFAGPPGAGRPAGERA
ncbi:TIGR03084 family metal-binding protein [Kineosporia sp. A_224]|uniref:TIGR03084 family metal-binding protein n=1 Tax=Kineosporia sp. A_224 TaxID=1962180 RepID=UPI000B4ADA87|nr:TIGR03084 family metal-binding protein [Kineosporia sp. A_224]